MAKASGTESKKGQISLLDRLKAWWYGYELRVVPKAPVMPAIKQHDVRADTHQWENLRIQLLQDVWGAGNSSPGDEEYIQELIKPFGLDPSKNILDIGAGLGGVGRIMSNTFGVWVTAMERGHELVEAGMEISTMAGMAKKAPVMAFDPEKFEFRPKSFDCIFSKESFYTIQNKEQFFKDTCRALKDGGQFLFTDFIASDDADPKALEAWKNAEGVPVQVWSSLDYEKGFTAGNVQKRVAEDITDRYLEMVKRGWTEYLGRLKAGGTDKKMEEVLVSEMELWAERTVALESGVIRLYRFLAIRQSQTQMMSDW
ncbi:class I SAM-dependent methyltransferase [Kiloniella laminariae]|uniref:class I SAM-dependent methyltransferase n=1 Tax=Kiloniella laminariae TaxID=454162 RepID=UPI00037A9FC0|nr:methyltransferase domain-containing protein [Kiloniella laminariae]